jgi:hypothetical protein
MQFLIYVIEIVMEHVEDEGLREEERGCTFKKT